MKGKEKKRGTPWIFSTARGRRVIPPYFSDFEDIGVKMGEEKREALNPAPGHDVDPGGGGKR